MKWLLALICVLSTPVFAQTTAPADAYLATLRKVTDECEVAAFKMALDENLASVKRDIDLQVAMASGKAPPDPLASMDDSMGNDLGTCEKSAPQVGIDAYKAFARQTHDQTMKNAAKKVLSAWLTYLPAVKVTSDAEEQHSGLEYTALQSAINDFKVDALVQN